MLVRENGENVTFGGNTLMKFDGNNTPWANLAGDELYIYGQRIMMMKNPENHGKIEQFKYTDENGAQIVGTYNESKNTGLSVIRKAIQALVLVLLHY